MTLESYHTANILYYGFYPSFEENESIISNDKKTPLDEEISFQKKKSKTKKLIDIKRSIKKIAEREMADTKVDELRSDLLKTINNLPKDDRNINKYIIHKIRYFRALSMFYKKKGYSDKAISNYEEGLKFIAVIENKYSDDNIRNWGEVIDYIQTYKKEEILYESK